MSEVGHLRRAVNHLAYRANFNQRLRGRAALVATEMGTNLVKHTAAGGNVLLAPLSMYLPQTGNQPLHGLELIALDQGPGITDPVKALENGVSTSGGLGGGLGAMQRLSNLFDFYTRPNQGTAILAQIWDLGPEAVTPASVWEVEAGGVVVAKPGEVESGDGWAIAGSADVPMILLVDGLGHGTEAAKAKKAALEAFQATVSQSPQAIVERLHHILHHTRGVVLALADFKLDQAELAYVGVGNISGRLLSFERDRGLLSFGGVVGAQLPRAKEMLYPWSERDILIMHTDGLKTQWQISNYPGLVNHHPTLTAAILYRDFARRTDDVAVVVARSRFELEN